MTKKKHKNGEPKMASTSPRTKARKATADPMIVEERRRREKLDRQNDIELYMGDWEAQALAVLTPHAERLTLAEYAARLRGCQAGQELPPYWLDGNDALVFAQDRPPQVDDAIRILMVIRLLRDARAAGDISGLARFAVEIGALAQRLNFRKLEPFAARGKKIADNAAKGRTEQATSDGQKKADYIRKELAKYMREDEMTSKVKSGRKGAAYKHIAADHQDDEGHTLRGWDVRTMQDILKKYPPKPSSAMS